MSEVIQVRSQYRMQEWAKIIQECEASGLSNKEFCEQNGVSIKSYYYWLRKLREAAMHQNQPSLVQLTSTTDECNSLQIKSQDQSDLDRRKIYRREIGRKARQKGHREYAGLQCQDIRLSVSPVQAGGIYVHRRQIIQRGEIVPHLSVVASQKFVSSGRHINIERLPLGSLTVQEVVHRLLGR